MQVWGLAGVTAGAGAAPPAEIGAATAVPAGKIPVPLSPTAAATPAAANSARIGLP